MRSFVTTILISLVLLALMPMAAHSQTGEATAVEEVMGQLNDPDQKLQPAAVDALVARLSDQEVRQILLEELGRRAGATPSPESAVDIAGLANRAEDQLETIGANFTQLLGAIPELPGAMATALSSLRGDRGWTFFPLLILGFATMIGIGLGLEAGFRYIAHKNYERIERGTVSLGGRFGQVFLATGLRLVSLAIFAIGGLAFFFSVWTGDEKVRVAVMTFFGAIVVFRLIGIIARLLLSPDHANHRLSNFADDDAHLLYRQAMIVTGITVFANATCAVYFVLGDQRLVHELLLEMAAILIFVAIIFGLWRVRGSITNDLRDDGASQIRTNFARAWPNILIIYTVFLFLLFQIIDLGGGHVSLLAGFGTLLAVMLLPHVDIGLERVARRLDAEGEGSQMRSVILRASRIALMVVMVFFVAAIWDIDLFALAENSAGTRLAGAMVDIGLTALVAYILWEVARIAIDRRMQEEGGPLEGEAGGEGGGQGASRLATLLPLIKRAVQTTIAVMAVMLILSALGVNIGPLLAGAGVVGLAIGFGAQTLVRDVVSGLFFLMDDAFRVGEYVDVGSVKGTVEKISVRSLRLRHHRGPVNTIPFGEISHLTNFSRDWVIMKLEFRVPFDTDIQLVKRIFKQIGKDLYNNPEIKDDFLDPFKSQGVYSVDDSALIIRAKFTAKPGKQFVIRREAYLAVQRAFAEHGIRFADRRVTVNVHEGDKLTEEEREKVGQAAASALATQPPKVEAAE